MKHIIALAVLSIAAACGTTQNDVTRSQAVPLSVFGMAPDHSGETSTRSSIDLLSLN